LWNFVKWNASPLWLINSTRSGVSQPQKCYLSCTLWHQPFFPLRFVTKISKTFFCIHVEGPSIKATLDYLNKIGAHSWWCSFRLTIAARTPLPCREWNWLLYALGTSVWYVGGAIKCFSWCAIKHETTTSIANRKVIQQREKPIFVYTTNTTMQNAKRGAQITTKYRRLDKNTSK